MQHVFASLGILIGVEREGSPRVIDAPDRSDIE
jgi:hypothetical protein